MEPSTPRVFRASHYRGPIVLLLERITYNIQLTTESRRGRRKLIPVWALTRDSETTIHLFYKELPSLAAKLSLQRGQKEIIYIVPFFYGKNRIVRCANFPWSIEEKRTKQMDAVRLEKKCTWKNWNSLGHYSVKAAMGSSVSWVSFIWKENRSTLTQWNFGVQFVDVRGMKGAFVEFLPSLKFIASSFLLQPDYNTSYCYGRHFLSRRDRIEDQ